jgi:hypothetical protein
MEGQGRRGMNQKPWCIDELLLTFSEETTSIDAMTAKISAEFSNLIFMQ